MEQWYLRAPQGELLALINVEAAWAAVSGSSRNVVVAVLDTGVRFDHPDLKRFTGGSAGRDDDAADPGDWLTAEDLASEAAQAIGCTLAGLGGDGRRIRVLPVRVLGKCRGFDSDVIPAMRWAVGFSDLGPEIAISTPAANCVNVVGVWLYPLLTTTNSGTTTPVSADESHTDDGDNATAGASFSSPLVAVTAALMLVAKSSLSTDEMRRLLQKSARTFPTSGDPNAAGTFPATDSGGDAEQSCCCTTSTCRAGMLDAGAAVALAQATEPASESMAGALGWGWLLGLAVAVLAVSRSHREA